ncbi:hypothetical protein WKW80_03890 [Variovorax humicola]|uniref:Uncharacterized protein n=1 Tax=Variovorax humicola TaxID=1769758 RepID=A0ABU8VVC2_9BURK
MGVGVSVDVEEELTPGAAQRNEPSAIQMDSIETNRLPREMPSF